MITASAHADALVNGVALIGLVFALIAMPPDAKASAVDKRLKGLYAGLLAFVFARQVYWLVPSAWMVAIIMAVAAWLPLLVLLVVEDVLRRHAPRHLKWLTLACGVAFTVTSLCVGRQWPRPLLIAFATVVCLIPLLMLVFIARNRRRDLSRAETRMADSIALALILCVPASVSEFHGLWPALPVALGTPAILLFVVMSAALATGIGTPLRFLLDIGALSLTAAAITLSTHWLSPGLGFADLVRLAANALCICAAVLIVYRLNEGRRSSLRRRTIVDALARLPDGVDAEAMIAAHPLTAAGTLLEAHQLSLYGEDVQAALSRHPVVTRGSFTAPDLVSAVQTLLDEHGATHLVRVRRAPLRLLALASGAVGDTSAVEAELTLLSRLAEKDASC